jgi:hypothetical protein
MKKNTIPLYKYMSRSMHAGTVTIFKSGYKSWPLLSNKERGRRNSFAGRRGGPENESLRNGFNTDNCCSSYSIV